MSYLNFFDDRLEPVRQGRLDLITEAYFALYPEKRGRGGLHCFLDAKGIAPDLQGQVARLRVRKAFAEYWPA